MSIVVLLRGIHIVLITSVLALLAFYPTNIFGMMAMSIIIILMLLWKIYGYCVMNIVENSLTPEIIDDCPSQNKNYCLTRTYAAYVMYKFFNVQESIFRQFTVSIITISIVIFICRIVVKIIRVN